MAGRTIPVEATSTASPAVTLARTGPVEALPGRDDRAGQDSREAYEVRIDTHGAQIRSRSSAGLYYGVQTMRQLVEGDPGERFLPEVTIRDWPALAYRGFMMDTSHGPLPTEDEVKRQIDFLARWKANQYYLYSEASIELRGFELVNPDGRYTQEQIRRIIEYARERHVGVVPNAELYAHLHDLFRVERFADLSLFAHSTEINPRNERVRAVLTDWIGQLAALFPSPWFHIGFDEPWELEKAKSIVGSGVEPSKLYIDQLKWTAELLQKLGKRPMFWADVEAGARIFAKYPELFSELPKDIIAVPWHYAPMPDYAAYVAPFAERHIPQVVQPGIWCWSEIAPDFVRTFANIDGFVADGRKYGALGMINSGWSDSGQALFRTTLAGMAYGAAAAWQSEPVDRRQFFSDYTSLMYPPNVASDVASGLDNISSAEHLLTEILGEDTVDRLWEDPLTPARLKRAEANRDKLRQERLLAEDAQERFERALRSTHDTYTLPSLLVAARMLDYAGMKHLYAAEIAGFFQTLGRSPSRSDVVTYLYRQISVVDHGRAGDLMDAITSLREPYRAAYRDEYTDYRLGIVLGRWDAEYEYWRRFQARLLNVFHSFRNGDTLPSLEELRPHP